MPYGISLPTSPSFILCISAYGTACRSIKESVSGRCSLIPLFGISVLYTKVLYMPCFLLMQLSRNVSHPCHTLSAPLFCRVGEVPPYFISKAGLHSPLSRTVLAPLDAHGSPLLFNFKTLIVDFLVALIADNHCFPAFCNHHHFPRLFPFQVFELVYMMNLKLPAFRTAT